jgi:hypothetical protein
MDAFHEQLRQSPGAQSPKQLVDDPSGAALVLLRRNESKAPGLTVVRIGD